MGQPNHLILGEAVVIVSRLAGQLIELQIDRTFQTDCLAGDAQGLAARFINDPPGQYRPDAYQLGEGIFKDRDLALIKRFQREFSGEATTFKQSIDQAFRRNAGFFCFGRQCVRGMNGSERYVRRMPDKIIWAVEQALEQGRNQLARMLSNVYSEAKAVDDRERHERRK